MSRSRSEPSPPRGRHRVALVVAAAAALVTASVVVAVTALASIPPTPSGWTLVFGDDFNGGAGTLPSGSNWTFDLGHSYPGGPGNWGTGEIQSYTNSTNNIQQDGSGNLRITPRRDSAGNWTSARIETNRADFKPAAGGILRIEGRVQMPNVTGNAALGYWPAFWALGSPYRGNFQNWPSIGEFDVMENVNGLNQVFGTLHCGTSPGGPCNETTGLGNTRACPNTTCQSSFHTYRFEWDRSITPNQLRWYVDGTQYHSVSQSQLPANTWSDMTSHNGYFILLNVAMGGGFPAAFGGGPTSATTPGVPMVVDYVAVWTRAGGATTTTTTSTTTTTTSGGGVSAYSTIQAESFSQQQGIQVENTTDTGGGQNIGWIANGDWARYNNVNFGSTPARTFRARVASGAGGGVSGLVQVRLDSPTNPVVADFAIGNTGGWQVWTTVPGNTTGITGTHAVYLTFSSGQPADFVNVNWFTFST